MVRREYNKLINFNSTVIIRVKINPTLVVLRTPTKDIGLIQDSCEGELMKEFKTTSSPQNNVIDWWLHNSQSGEVIKSAVSIIHC